MNTDLNDLGQCLNKGDNSRPLSEKESLSVQSCTVSISSNSGLQQDSTSDGYVTEVSKVPTDFCTEGGRPLLGARLTFAPLEESWADRLRETGVNFTQEDLDCLCDYINSSNFMHYYYLFSVSGFSYFLKVAVLCVVIFYSTAELFSVFIFVSAYIAVILMPLFAIGVSNALLLNFNKSSFRHTNTVVSFSHGFCQSKPMVTLTAYRLEPCKEVVSNLFKIRYFQQSQHSKLDEKKWDRAVHQFVCSCVINIFEIRRFFAKSKTKVHICSTGEKCICELILEAADLSAFPPNVAQNKLRKAYSMFGFFIDAFRHKIVFRYSDNSIDPKGLDTQT